MSAASALRIQIERSLEHRFPSALTPAPRAVYEIASTGIQAVDAVLEGGLPVGAISELTGPRSSGRTSIALSFLARKTQNEQVVAWVDANDALDPESAAAAGVVLSRLLWVRCRNAALSKDKPWSRLDQALRATDLLLQAAGFGAIILDLGSTAPEHASRIPLATWFRYRQGAQRSRASLVVLGKMPYAQSSAAVVLECVPKPDADARDTVLEGLQFAVSRQRQRFQQTSARKPPASTWSASNAWSVVR
jgi:recombination protein RecA